MTREGDRERVCGRRGSKRGCGSQVDCESRLQQSPKQPDGDGRKGGREDPGSEGNGGRILQTSSVEVFSVETDRDVVRCDRLSRIRPNEPVRSVCCTFSCPWGGAMDCWGLRAATSEKREVSGGASGRALGPAWLLPVTVGSDPTPMKDWFGVGKDGLSTAWRVLGVARPSAGFPASGRARRRRKGWRRRFWYECRSDRRRESVFRVFIIPSVRIEGSNGVTI